MCILFAYATIVSVYTEKLQTLSLPVEGNVLRGSFYIVCILIFFFFLVAWCGMWDLSSLTKDLTNTHCSGKGESYPLDYQGSPLLLNFELSEWTYFFESSELTYFFLLYVFFIS